MRLSRLSPSRVRSQTKLFMNGHDLNPLVDCLGTLRQPSAKSEGESLPHKPSRGLSRSKERLGQKKVSRRLLRGHIAFVYKPS